MIDQEVAKIFSKTITKVITITHPTLLNTKQELVIELKKSSIQVRSFWGLIIVLKDNHNTPKLIKTANSIQEKSPEHLLQME